MEEYKAHSINEIAEKYIEGVPQIVEVAVNPDEDGYEGSEQIRGEKNEDSTIQEGTITYDIRFLAIVPGTGETICLGHAEDDNYTGILKLLDVLLSSEKEAEEEKEKVKYVGKLSE